MRNTRFNLNFTILFFLLFIDKANGQLAIEWQSNYGGSNFEQPFMSAPTRDGGIISGGYTESTDGDAIGNHGNYDWLIVKTNKFGVKEWARTYGGNDYDKCRAIMQNDDGTYMAFGSSHSSNGDVPQNYGYADFWLLRLDSLGNIIHNKTYGGTGREGGRGIIRTSDRGWMLVGWTSFNDSDIVGNHGSKDAWLCKLDSNMNMKWNQNYGGSEEDRARDVIELPDGSYVFGGNSKSNDGDVSFNYGDEDFFMGKVNSMGTLIWSTTVGSTAQDRIFGVAADWDGGFLGIGRNGTNDGDVNDNHGGQDLWISKVDSLGSIVWLKSLGGSSDDGGFRIEPTTDHGYLITGTTKSADGDSPGIHGESDYWFIKLDSLLDFVQNDHIGGKRHDHCVDIFKSQDGGYYFSGFSTSIDTFPINFNNYGQADFWIVKAFYCTPQIFTISPSDTIVCPGNSITIATDSNFVNYLWSNSDTTTTITVSDTGAYYFIQTEFNGVCVYHSDTIQLSNFAAVTPIITYNNSSLIASGAGNFQWYFNNNPITGATSNILSPITQSGDYTVTLLDVNSCFTTSNSYLLSVGISPLSNSLTQLLIYPNPSIDQVNIKFTSNIKTPSKLIIKNILGQTLIETDFEIIRGENSNSINISGLSKGTYTLNLLTPDASLTSWLFLKN
ncbi:MAG: T9SS type A sorting domain-containing protein [Bacteroidetes bacterium]|nr:T9SS type A sorting domain-containing protein [Bacteroidota bacterium]